MGSEKAKDLIDEITSEENDFSAEGLTDEQKKNLNNDGHFEFGTQQGGKKEEKKEDPKQEKDTSPEKKESEEDPDEIKKKLELTEKRRKDTESAYQREHQAKLKLEKKLKEIEEKKPSGKDDGPVIDDEDDADLLFGEDEPINKDDKPAEKPEDSGIKAELDEVKQRQEELERQRAIDAWEREAEKVKQNKDDFDEIVYNVFEKAFETSPAVKEEFNSKGATPAVAYEMGKKLKAYEEALSGKLPEEKAAKKTFDDGGLPPDQALGGNSTITKTQEITDTGDIIDDALAGIT